MDLGSSHREQAVTGHCQKFSFFTADHAQVWIQGQAIENKQLQGDAKSFLFLLLTMPKYGFRVKPLRTSSYRAMPKVFFFFTADHTQVWTQGQAIENKQW